MAGLAPPRLAAKLVPVFTSKELTRPEQACAGHGFGQRRDTAIIAVLRATGIRLAELAGLRYHPGDPARSDLDCTPGRSGSAARAARPGPSRSATRRLVAWTATSAPAPGTHRPGGRSCGSA